jgi:hypothetical protein
MSYTTIEIYCDDARWHPGTRCNVRRFARTGPSEWTPLRWLIPAAEDDLWDPKDANVSLDVGTNRDIRKDAVLQPFTRRELFRIPCYQCKQHGRYRRRKRENAAADMYVKEPPLSIRDSRLSEILESHYQDTGESELSLGDLAARLRSSAGP